MQIIFIYNKWKPIIISAKIDNRKVDKKELIDVYSNRNYLIYIYTTPGKDLRFKYSEIYNWENITIFIF